MNSWTTIAHALAFLIAVGPTLALANDTPSDRAAPPYAEIDTLVRRHCITCHTRDGGAPFPFETPRDVRRRARQIAHVVERRFMPPWLPTGGKPIVGERRLSDEDVQRFVAWAEAGAPIDSNVTSLRPAPLRVESWPAGPPAVVIGDPRSYRVPADGNAPFRSFVVPAPVETPRWVSAIDLRTTAPRTLHSVLFLVDGRGVARRLDAADEEFGYPADAHIGTQLAGSWGGWAMGLGPLRLPAGFAFEMPPAHDLVYEAHYSTTGKAEANRIEIALYAAASAADAPPRPVVAVALGDLRIDVPAGTTRRLEETLQLPVDVDLLGVLPMAHFVCQQIELRASSPGKSTTLLEIEDWDFNWMQPYFFVEPVPLEAGSTVSASFHFDNTTANPQNPRHPPRHVRAGRAPDDEVAAMILYLSPRRRDDRARLEAFHRDAFRARLERYRAWRQGARSAR